MTVSPQAASAAPALVDGSPLDGAWNRVAVGPSAEAPRSASPRRSGRSAGSGSPSPAGSTPSVAAGARRPRARRRTRSSPCSGSRPAWPPTSAPRPTTVAAVHRRRPSSRSRPREGDRPGLPRQRPRPLLPLQGRAVHHHRRRGARRHGLDAVAYGENADDVRRPDRPGARAATRARRAAAAGRRRADKAAVRRVARALGLPCADKPAAPCLASRIPHFERGHPGEARARSSGPRKALRALGFTDCRVRHHGDVARIELPVDDLRARVQSPRCATCHRAVGPPGSGSWPLDLAGIQSGAFTLPLVAVRHG